MKTKKSPRQVGLKLFIYLLQSAQNNSTPARRRQSDEVSFASDRDNHDNDNHDGNDDGNDNESPSAEICSQAKRATYSETGVMLNLWVKICRKSSRCH